MREERIGDCRLILGDCRAVLATLEPDSFDSVVCDPPYHLTAGKKGGSGEASVNPNSPAGRSMVTTGFMGKEWDGGDVAFQPETWAAVYRVLKPGAHLVAFGGTRTVHRMACAIEDAGFEIRDSLMWLYGSGFPKSLDVSKAIDKAAGAEREVLSEGRAVKRMIPGADQDKTGSWIKDNGREFVPTETAPATEAAHQWQGWGTALKPAHEPIILARKPLAEKTVAANVLTHGVGALNIDGCRVGNFVNTTPPGTDRYNKANHEQGYRPSAYGRDGEASAECRYTANGSTNFAAKPGPRGGAPEGRFPPNVLHDGSPEVLEVFARFGEKTSGKLLPTHDAKPNASGWSGGSYAGRVKSEFGGDTGTAARFFPDLGFHYSGKATKADRAGSTHPTIKPQALMRWLCRLVTPPGGHVLDCFAGSGSTLQAARAEGFRATGIELTPEYFEDIKRRLATKGDDSEPGLFDDLESAPKQQVVAL